MTTLEDALKNYAVNIPIRWQVSLSVSTEWNFLLHVQALLAAFWLYVSP